MNIELNIVTCPTYPQKFIRDNVVAPSVLVSIVLVTLAPDGAACSAPGVPALAKKTDLLIVPGDVAYFRQECAYMKMFFLLLYALCYEFVEDYKTNLHTRIQSSAYMTCDKEDTTSVSTVNILCATQSAIGSRLIN